VDGRGQSGLLDVELGPDSVQSCLISWTYGEPREGGNGLAVARARLVDGAKPRLEDVKIVFSTRPTVAPTLHAGGRLVFAPDDKLLVMLEERSILPGRVQARDLKSHCEKSVRINPDGSVPRDNPFVGRKDARPERWSLDHRNILSAARDAQQRLWIVEMGPRGDDKRSTAPRPARTTAGPPSATTRSTSASASTSPPGSGHGAARVLLGPGHLPSGMNDDRVVSEERLLKLTPH
jgi:glucose/arabinose dehydrogenase